MTTKQTQHSPLPWRIESNQFAIWDDKHAVAAIYNTAAPEPMASEARANADMIVRAVNSHYTLVHCLSRAVATEEQLARLDGRDLEDWCVAARAALALALGEGR